MPLLLHNAHFVRPSNPSQNGLIVPPAPCPDDPPALRAGCVSTREASDTLPDDYVWPEEDRPTLAHDDFERVGIPVVDLAKLHSDEALSLRSSEENIVSAIIEWGLFYVVNHSLPQSLVQLVDDLGHQLFSLPSETKMKAQRSPDGGIAGYGKPLIGKFFGSQMWTEGFTMIGSPSSCIPDLVKKIWPCEGTEFSAIFEEYDIAMRKLAVQLLLLIFGGFSIDSQAFLSKQFDPQDCQGGLHLNYYPPCPEPSKTIGLPPHTDSTFLTILHQGDVGGLQIYRHGRWISVPPLRNAFVVNVGDMLQILTNGKCKSLLHRAVVNKRTARLSLAYLFGPPLTATIRPMDELVCPQNPSLYRPLSWKEYLEAKSKHFMGAMQTFKYWPQSHI